VLDSLVWVDVIFVCFSLYKDFVSVWLNCEQLEITFSCASPCTKVLFHELVKIASSIYFADREDAIVWKCTFMGFTMYNLSVQQ
jgi:hypothetical protein